MKKFYFLLVVLSGFGSVSGQIVNIPDAAFKAKLINATASTQTAKNLEGNYFTIDANNDDQIDVTEALQVTFLDFNGVIGANIVNLSGIEYFTSLVHLDVSFNALTGNLNLSQLVNLEYLECNHNELTGININMLSNLQKIVCFSNDITSLNFVGNNSLKEILCSGNLLSTLDVTSCTNLELLNCSTNPLNSLFVNGLANLKHLTVRYCPISTINLAGLSSIEELNFSYTSLTSLDVSNFSSLLMLDCRLNSISNLNLSGATALLDLKCSDNLLTTLDVSGLSALTAINCSNNQLTTLDFTDLTALTNLVNIQGNPLESLFIKNGTQQGIFLNNTTTIDYVCADDFDYIDCFTCEVNTYCTFELGNGGFVINGSAKFDGNGNGCEETDTSAPNFKFTISNESLQSNFSSNSLGQYAIHVQASTHTIAPALENSTYFNVSPETATVTFPATESPFTQNFCITPNGVYQDLDVTLIPLNVVIPGFDATYKVVYRNIGNVNIAAGNITLQYNDTTLDYVSSTSTSEIVPVGNLFFTFLNLQPFETRTIDVTFNLNSPMETPPLNSGDILSFEVAVGSSVGEDSNPIDNITTLRQIVVNSFDPNDKICLEGTQITPDMIGKYVHYMIRFENTGTFAAQNVVVKDIIDEEKFDVSTLIPLNASDNYETMIKYGKVEFIFKNINLPFDEANNDGYIVFKIKTLPTLALGDSFSNSASIYFDYNFPIVTDPAVTTFAVLSSEDFVFNNYLTVYPNPTKEILNITSKQSIELKSMEVYNILGQLVLSIPNANGVDKVDVSNLNAGTYFLKVSSDKGTSNSKFIKN